MTDQKSAPLDRDELAAQMVQERRSKANKYLAGITDEGLALCIDKTDLHYAYDTQGRTYIDMTSAGGALPMGANHLVRNALYAPTEPYIGLYGASCQGPQVSFAQLLSERFPQYYDEPLQVFLTCSGVAAMETAQSMANFANTARANIKPLNEATYEPMDTGKAQQVCEMAIDRDYAIIMDERISGFGRFGSFRAAQRYDLDRYVGNMITVLGEAAGGGIPIGAVVAPRRYFPPGVPWLHPHHGGSPLACAAGFQILSLQTEFFYDHVRDVAADFENQIEGLCSQFPRTTLRQQGRGMARAIVIHDRIEPDLLMRALLNNGVIAQVAQVDALYLRLTPPLTMTATATEEAINQIAAAMVELEVVVPVST